MDIYLTLWLIIRSYFISFTPQVAPDFAIGSSFFVVVVLNGSLINNLIEVSFVFVSVLCISF